MKNFNIKIKSQHWLDQKYANQDLCSHGNIELNIDGTIITSPDIDEEWGISESALALLRTVRYDHPSKVPSKKEDIPSVDCLIYHGCGAILMLGCPISINWDVKHNGNKVTLNNFIKCPTTNDSDVIKYPDIDITLDINEYASEIVNFAKKAMGLFDEKKDIDDEYDKLLYTEFWREYNELLNFAESILGYK